MSLDTTVSSLSFVGNASTSTAYALTDLRYDDPSWVVAYTVDADGAKTSLTLGTHFTLGGDGTGGAGTLTSTAGNAIPATSTLHVERATPQTQDLTLPLNSPVATPSLEAQLDQLVMVDQDLDRERTQLEARSLRVPDGETLTQIAAKASRLGKLVYFDASTGDISLKTPNEVLTLSDGAPTGIGLPSGGTSGDFLTSDGAGGSDWSDAEDTRDLIGLPIGRVSIDEVMHGPNIVRTMERVAQRGLNVPPALTFLAIGDSFVANTAWDQIGEHYFGMRVSCGGGTNDTRWFTNGGTTLGAGVGDMTRSPYGDYWQLTSGQTLVLDDGGSAIYMRKLHVMYTAENGAGVFSVEEDTGSGYGAIDAALTSVDTDNSTDPAPVVITHDWADSDGRKIRITCDSGTVRIWGVCGTDRWGAVGQNRPGFEAWNFGHSGDNIANFSGASQDMVDALYQTLAPDIVTWRGDDSAANINTGWPALWTKIQAAFPSAPDEYPDIVLIGQHPSNASPDIGLTDNVKALRDLAVTNNWTFVNARNLYRSYSLADDVGLMADSIHLTTAGYNIAACLVCSRIADLLRGTFTPADFVDRQQDTYGAQTRWLADTTNLETVKQLDGTHIGTDLARRAFYQREYRGGFYGDNFHLGFDAARFLWCAGASGFGDTLAALPISTAGASFTFIGSDFNDCAFRVVNRTQNTSQEHFEVFRDGSTSSAGTKTFGINHDGTVCTEAGFSIANAAGGGPEWTGGTASPSSAPSDGSIYSRTSTAPGLYVHADDTWYRVPKVMTKADTGDPGSGMYEGDTCINTFDNTYKVYAEGAWRSLATW